jgi:hypothetical protein
MKLISETLVIMKKECTSNHEDEENTGSQAIPPVPHPKSLQTQ